MYGLCWWCDADWREQDWRQTLESKGFRFSKTKIEYMRCQFGGYNSDDENISLDGQIIPMNDIFWYFRSMLQNDGGMDEDISHRIRAEWLKWMQTSGILCSKKVQNKLKDKFYMMVVRPAMIYVAKYWVTKGQHI
jgi:hypothetical protein